MKQQPDNIFKEKLSAYQRPAPAMAWDKVEANLEGNARRMLWLRVAASLVVLLGIGVGVWMNNGADQRTTDVAVNETPAQKHTAPIKERVPPALEAIEKELSAVSAEEKQAVAITELKANERVKSTVTQPDRNEQAKSETIIDEEIVINESIATAYAVTDVEDTQADTMTPIIEHSVTLVYTLEKASKYLAKSEQPEATSSEKKSSTFQRMLKKATDLKSNQDPVGELRQMKNEILALNFKNEKRGQNK